MWGVRSVCCPWLCRGLFLVSQASVKIVFFFASTPPRKVRSTPCFNGLISSDSTVPPRICTVCFPRICLLRVRMCFSRASQNSCAERRQSCIVEQRHEANTLTCTIPSLSPLFPPPFSFSLLHSVHLHGVARSGACRAGEAEAGQCGAVPPHARDRRVSCLHRLLLRTGRVGVRCRGEQHGNIREKMFACGRHEDRYANTFEHQYIGNMILVEL